MIPGFLLIFLWTNCIAQYTVTKVIGLVKNKTSGEILRAGSKLSDDDVLTFSTPNDIVRVIVAGKGIYIISPSIKPGTPQQSEIEEILRTALHVKFREGYLSGRSEKTELIPAILETQEAVNKNNLFEDVNKYIFDGNTYNSSHGRFFLQIESQGAGTFVHRLQTVSDTLIIYASDFKTEGKIDPEKTIYKLGFFSKEKNSSESLALIRPYIDSTAEMETVMKLIIDENRQADTAKIEETCYSEVYAALGKPSSILFKDIFNRLIAGISRK